MPNLVPIQETPLGKVAGLLDIKEDAAEFTDKEKLVLITMALFKGLLDEAMSGDVRALAIYRAAAMLRGVLPKQEVLAISRRLMAMLRTPQPMDGLFSQE